MTKQDDRYLGLHPQFWGKAKKLGITDPVQLMLVTPSTYIDLSSPITSLSHLNIGDTFFAKLLVVSRPRQGAKMPARMTVSDGQSLYDVIIYGNPVPFNSLNVNSAVHLRGKISAYNNQLQISNPELITNFMQGRVVPVYSPGESGLNRLTLASRIAELVEAHIEKAVDALRSAIPGDERENCLKLGMHFRGYESLIRALHAPVNMNVAEHAKQCMERLAAYEQLSYVANNQRLPRNPRIALPSSARNINHLLERLPFTLTSDQLKATTEILNDLTKPVPMRRLLSGDVGCGKTITYLLPALVSHLYGKQVAIMMPNTLLAAQVHGEFTSMFPEIPSALITGKSKATCDPSDKPILFGTTAILNWVKKQRIPVVIDVAIIDEQQKMGMNQKRDFAGPETHLLEATATAVPRSTALVMYGGYSLSRINQIPVEKKISTTLLGYDERKRALNLVREVVRRGGQVAILYPQREEELEEGKVGKRAVEQVFEQWNRLYPGRVGWIHGQVSDEAKAEAIEKMRQRELDIIIATSLIEIGITMPNLRALITLEAERYGANTLHQFRGRVARKGGHGNFVMITSTPLSELKPLTRDRLEILVKTTNGLEIAEMDLQLRGFGDLSNSAIEQKGHLEGFIPGVKVTPQLTNEVIDCLQKYKQWRQSQAQAQNMGAGPANI